MGGKKALSPSLQVGSRCDPCLPSQKSLCHCCCVLALCSKDLSVLPGAVKSGTSWTSQPWQACPSLPSHGSLCILPRIQLSWLSLTPHSSRGHAGETAGLYPPPLLVRRSRAVCHFLQCKRKQKPMFIVNAEPVWASRCCNKHVPSCKPLPSGGAASFPSLSLARSMRALTKKAEAMTEGATV